MGQPGCVTKQRDLDATERNTAWGRSAVPSKGPRPPCQGLSKCWSSHENREGFQLSPTVRTVLTPSFRYTEAKTLLFKYGPRFPSEESGMEIKKKKQNRKTLILQGTPHSFPLPGSRSTFPQRCPLLSFLVLCAQSFHHASPTCCGTAPAPCLRWTHRPTWSWAPRHLRAAPVQCECQA